MTTCPFISTVWYDFDDRSLVSTFLSTLLQVDPMKLWLFSYLLPFSSSSLFLVEDRIFFWPSSSKVLPWIFRLC